MKSSIPDMLCWSCTIGHWRLEDSSMVNFTGHWLRHCQNMMTMTTTKMTTHIYTHAHTETIGVHKTRIITIWHAYYGTVF